MMKNGFTATTFSNALQDARRANRADQTTRAAQSTAQEADPAPRKGSHICATIFIRPAPQGATRAPFCWTRKPIDGYTRSWFMFFTLPQKSGSN
jgi:hypothetical protein